MAHDRELLDAQGVGDAGHVGGREQGSGGAPTFGVPWCQNTARRSLAPSATASYTWSVRPSPTTRSVCVTTRRA
jgi:hypothetical protein